MGLQTIEYCHATLDKRAWFIVLNDMNRIPKPPTGFGQQIEVHDFRERFRHFVGTKSSPKIFKCIFHALTLLRSGKK